MTKKFAIVVAIIGSAFQAYAQTTQTTPSKLLRNHSVDSGKWPTNFGFGRTAKPIEIARLQIDVRPDGQGLPAGSGSALRGKSIYAAKCAACHGPVDQKNQTFKPIAPKLVTDSLSKVKTIGNYWPYTSTIFDYIRRSMPYNAPGSLTNDEVYSLTAYLLCANKIMASGYTLNAQTLPKIKMPAQHLFVNDDRKGGHEVK